MQPGEIALRHVAELLWPEGWSPLHWIFLPPAIIFSAVMVVLGLALLAQVLQYLRPTILKRIAQGTVRPSAEVIAPLLAIVFARRSTTDQKRDDQLRAIEIGLQDIERAYSRFGERLDELERVVGKAGGDHE